MPAFDPRKCTCIMNGPNTLNVLATLAVCMVGKTTDLLYCRSIDRYLISYS